jgi:phosphonate ABC transporter permease subunit PhnE
MTQGRSRVRKPRPGHPLVRVLTVVFIIVVVVVVYAFAFEKTDVDLEEVKSPERRESLIRILRGLARPDLIEFPEQQAFHETEVMVPCPAGGFTPAEPDTSGAYITVEPACADPGGEVTVRGFGFTAGTSMPLSFIPNTEGVVLRRANVDVSSSGTFEAVIDLPERTDDQVQHLRVTSVERQGGWSNWTWSKPALDTWDKIIETVMLALMATTLGIAVGIPLSFFSARNLMRGIRSPLLSVALFLVGIPLGVFLGSQWGGLVTHLGEGVFLDHPVNAAIALAAFAGAGWLLMRWLLATGGVADPSRRARYTRIGAWIVMVLITLEGILLAGYLLIWIGDVAREPMGPFGFLAGFLAKLGDILTTFFAAAVAIFAAGALAMGGSRLGHALNDHLPRPMVRMLRYPAGGLAVAVITVSIGGLVNWLYRYGADNQAIPATAGAALLGITGAILAVRWARPLRNRIPGLLSTLFGFVVATIGLLAGGALGIALGNAMERLVGLVMDGGSLLSAGLVGAILGLGLAWATRHLDALPTGLVTYYLSRSLFNAVRSVEPLVMAIVFVVWVGLGPFAGSLALALHTVAGLAKLYSEQVESILPGPIEAVTSTGATRLQNVIYAVVPQIVPPYIAFTLYRWDINVRMSTIIGFAGGGGIGFLLQQNINLVQYRAASVQMLAIAVVVSSLDFLSARIRDRIV